MTDIELEVRRLAAGSGRQVSATSLWLHVTPADAVIADHGWKLHISVRAADFPAVVADVVPVLLAAGCPFKLARTVEVLTNLNDGQPNPAAVGKAFTIYPEEHALPELARQLVGLLRDRVAPRVLSDRQVDPDAPVYYRYGPFLSAMRAEPDGKVISSIVGPDGVRFDGTADFRYRQPSWATDPFGRAAEPASAALLGGRYRLVKGIFQSPRGNVYVATDVRTGDTVVVKQARAYVGENTDGSDARLRLRNERYALAALDDVSGVPRCLDHFRHDSDEFLVTTFAGKFNLGEDVARRGRYRPSTVDGPRSLDSLAHRLGRILRDVHAKGFVFRDLSPRNVVVDDRTFDVMLVDFGICHHGDVKMPGGTAGFAPERQFSGAPARPADDCHALGMVLLYAATGAPPVVDLDARSHALQMVDRIYGHDLPPAIAHAVRLLSEDPATAEAALLEGPGAPVTLTVRAPAYTPDLLDQTRENVLSAINRRLDDPDGFVESNVYRGVAGVGLELLHHLDAPGVAETVRRLQSYCVESSARLNLPPGLFLGTTGVEIFLRQARIAGSDGPVLPSYVPPAGWRPEGDEIVIGAAGVGLGHLVLDRLAPDPEHRRVVRECLDWVTRHLDPESTYLTEDVGDDSGMDPTVGFAHGTSGVVALLLAARDTDVWSETLEKHLIQRLEVLRSRTPRLIENATLATAVPLALSWCRGLAGVGRTLLRAGRQLDDAELTKLAVSAGSVCREWIPYLANRGQCCGISGVGEFFLDLATEDGAAESAATQLVVRGLGKPPTAAVTKLGEQDGVTWAGGLAGELAFLRRLRDRTPGNPIGPFPTRG
jgi:serine/threonine protein kinase